MGAGVPEAVLSSSRLAAVVRTGLHGEARPERSSSFQRLVDLASEIVGAPLGFFTVVDADRSWYVAAAGVPAEVVCGPVESSFCKYVIESGQPLFVTDAPNDPVTAGNPAIDEMHVRSWAGFPVADADGEVLGSFCVMDTEPRQWSERDHRIIEVLAGAAADEIERLVAVRGERAALALADRRRDELDELLSRQREVLTMMQHSLLPARLPTCDGLDLAVRYEPANPDSGLGGDWYDVIDLGDGRSALVIADVSGHDPEAVAVMAQLRPSLHVVARTALAPGAVLRELHELMVELGVGRFLTIFYGIWDPADRSVTYECAGHPPPVLLGADGVARIADPGRTPLLGIAGIEPVADEKVLTLEPGATLVAFTDGLVEQPTQSVDSGLAALSAQLEHHAGLSVDELADRLMALTADPAGWFDDVALLVARARP